MQITTTPQFFVYHFDNYHGQPAKVYISKLHFARTADMHGWGPDCTATDVVSHCGSETQLGEVLFDTLKPSRVVR